MAHDKGRQKLWRIGAVSRLTGVNPHTLRYWEEEFQILTPNRQLSKQRLYRQADIDLIREIKRLLKEEKYTLSGVKQYLATRRASPAEAAAPAATTTPPLAGAADARLLQFLQRELQAIRAALAEPTAADEDLQPQTRTGGPTSESG
ncbi:MAG: MerR family transcriptional regulator [Desulfobacca sp.]|uniref:MerR family transcriptional regulator n=1 Tax=Desulfobacca sp. TaxID=2067990 RepID=UPI00404AD023